MTKVYMNFDRDELDRQYDVRGGIPDHDRIFARWKRDSEVYRSAAGAAAHIDLAYGEGPQQSLDLFQTRETGTPLLVFLHGGYWQSLDKSDFSYVAQSYVEDGINVAVVGYRLTPAVTIDDVVADCRAALAWIRRHAERFGVDRDRIVVSGSSAGGHLTAVMASTDWRSFDLPETWISGALALSGLYDLEPIRLCFLNGKIGLDEAAVQRASPVHMVPDVGPPLVLSTGGDETSEFHRQESLLAQKWCAKGLDCSTIAQDDGHHFDMVDRLATRGSNLYSAVFALAS